MSIQELYDLLIDDIVQKISQSHGLQQFANRRAKFEGWLKVTVIDILVQKGYNALPEIGFVDVTFDDVAIELKTVNTNISYENVVQVNRPITKNTASVISDIEQLHNSAYNSKFVLFVTFPIEHNNANWQVQLRRITAQLENIMHQDFVFSNGVPGVLYLGLVSP